MKLKRLKLNVISAESLRQKEMNAIVGGKSCTCSCYWETKNGSSSGTNMHANYRIGGYSSQGCNEYCQDDDLGVGSTLGTISAYQ